MSNITQELEKLEERKAAIIDKRHKQIASIITAAGALTLDDQLIAGAMLFLANPENKGHDIITEFKKLGAKIPSRRRAKKTKIMLPKMTCAAPLENYSISKTKERV